MLDDLLLPTSTLVHWRHRPGVSLTSDRLRLARSSESTVDQISHARRNLNAEAFELLGETPPPGIHVALFLEQLRKVIGNNYRVFGAGRTFGIQGLTGSVVMRSTSFKQTRLADPCHHQLTVDFDKAKLIEAVKEKYLAGVMSTSLAFLSGLQFILTGMYRSGLGTIIDRSCGLEKTQPDISRQEIYWFVGIKYWSFLMRPDIVNKILTDPAVCDILDAVKVGQSGSDLGAMIDKLHNYSTSNGYAGNIAWIAIGVPVGCDPLVLEQSTHLYGVRVLKHGEWFGKSILTRILDIQSRLGARVISCFMYNDFQSPQEIQKDKKKPGFLYVIGPNFDSHTKQVLRNAYNSMPRGPVGDVGRKYCFNLLYGHKTGQSTRLGNERICALYSTSPWTELEVIRTSPFKSADNGGHGGMKWHKADGDEDDLVLLNNNLSGRGREARIVGGGNDSNSVDEAPIVGGDNNSNSVDEAPIVGRGGKVCNFFSKGRCIKGKKCLFRHDIDPGTCKKRRGKVSTKRRSTERSNRQSNGGGGREGK
jgi:hypothetical protein